MSEAGKVGHTQAFEKRNSEEEEEKEKEHKQKYMYIYIYYKLIPDLSFSRMKK